MWLPRCLRTVGWMPEKMTIAGGEDIRRPGAYDPPVKRAVVIVAGLALASLLVVAPAPSYDPWAWLLWGRELAGGSLSTAEGPAFKPLPVAVCALLAPLGGAAPWLWVALVRCAAAVAAVLAFRHAQRLAGGSRLAVALGLGAAAAWSRDRIGLALALGAACGLVRVEAWPFLLAAGVVAWRREPRARPLLA